METSSKTAERAKHFIDQVDSSIQKFDQEIQEIVTRYQQKYHQKVEELQAEVRLLSEEHLDPLKQKLVEIKAESISYSDELERKWQDIKLEMGELLEKAKLAVKNFKKTAGNGS